MLSPGSQNKNSSALNERFKSACSRANLKVTHQRLRIYLELLNAGDHPTAENLHSRLKSEMPKLSLDTVYRTLSTFERQGLVRRVSTVNSQARYEAEMREHHHFVCTSCGMVADFNWPLLDQSSLPEEVAEMGIVSHRTLTASGICSECSGKNPAGLPADQSLVS